MDIEMLHKEFERKKNHTGCDLTRLSDGNYRDFYVRASFEDFAAGYDFCCITNDIGCK